MSADRVASILGPPVQVAYAVPDAVEAAARWYRLFGAGPFFVRPHLELVDVIVRGRPGTFDHTSAYGQWGPVMVELVQVHGGGPSPIGELHGPGESGLHHLAFAVEDLDTVLARLIAEGHQLAMSARTTSGVEFYFVDAVACCGHLLELYRPSARLQSFYSTVAAAADGWDGNDPVRWS
jgi:hypothetical protein